MASRSTSRGTLPSKACVSCHRAKTRCLPSLSSRSCQRCVKKGIDCEWAVDQRSARQDTRAHVERLEARIRELEAQLSKESTPEANAEDPGATARRLADLDLQSNAAPAGALTLDSEGQLRWHTETNAFDCQPVEPRLAHTSSKLAFLPVPLSSSLHRSLLDLAFTWHFDSWRLVERDEFMEDLWTGERTHSYSPFVHLAVLAVGCLYVLDPPPELCTDPSDSSTRGEPFIDAALELLSQEIAAPKFSSICGVMAIANYYGGTARPHRGWIYGGIAHRLVMDFGLHIDPPADSPIDEDLRVLRRKVFWAAFVNDVSWSLCIGRKTPFSLEEIHQPIPPFDASLAQPGTGALWPAEIRIKLIAWRVCRLHYSEKGQALEEGVRVETVKRLHRDLLDIFDSLPDFCRGDSLTMSPDVLQIQLTYHGLILLLLKPYLVKPPDNETANFAFDRCADASERIAKVVQQYQAKPTFRRVPNSVYQAMYYSGQTSIIIACRALTSPHPSAPEFTRRLEYVNICIGALLDYSQVYKMGAASASALARLRDRMLEERLSVPKSDLAPSISAALPNTAAESGSTKLPREPRGAAVPADDLVTVASWLSGTSGTIPNLSAPGASTSAALPLLPSLADLAAGGTAPEPPLETRAGAQDPLGWILQDHAMSPEVAGGTYDWQIQAAGRLANTAFAP